MKNSKVIRSLGFLMLSLTYFAVGCGTQQENENVVHQNSDVLTESQVELGLAVPASIPSGYTYEGVGFTMTATSGTHSKPVWRLYNHKAVNHFYTANAAEMRSAQRIGYKLEGIAFYTPNAGTVSVYRLYHPELVNHFYTASSAERDYAKTLGYKVEGVAFNAYCAGACETDISSKKSVNIHRFFFQHKPFLLGLRPVTIKVSRTQERA